MKAMNFLVLHKIMLLFMARSVNSRPDDKICIAYCKNPKNCETLNLMVPDSLLFFDDSGLENLVKK